MVLFSLSVSAHFLTDVQRRSFYVSVTLVGRRVWLQWWPRPIAYRRMLTCGVAARLPNTICPRGPGAKP
jgi:hypothetical protein